MARKSGRPTKAESENTPPTVETEAKLVPNVLLAMSADLQNAAICISTAFHVLCASQLAKASSFEKTITGSPREFSRTDLLLILRYQAWMRRAFKRGLPTAELIDMIFDGNHPDSIDLRCKWSPGTAHDWLVRGLEMYLKTEIAPDAKGRNTEQRLAQTGDSRAAA